MEKKITENVQKTKEIRYLFQKATRVTINPKFNGKDCWVDLIIDFGSDYAIVGLPIKEVHPHDGDLHYSYVFESNKVLSSLKRE